MTPDPDLAEWFTLEDLEHIERIAAEPFEAADPAEVAAFFRGGSVGVRTGAKGTKSLKKKES